VAPRQIAPVGLVLAITVAGFFGARALGERDAHRDSEHRADVAAAQIRERIDQGSSLTEGLRRLMVSAGGAGVVSAEFATNASSWLSPAGFPAAAWVEQVPASGRAAYERRIGRPIVTQDQRGTLATVGSRPSYLPATLVSGVTPMRVPGIDLGSESGVPAALTRASTLYDAGATPLATRGDGTKGLLLIRFAPRLTRGVLEPGFVVVFVSELALRAAVTDTPVLRLTVGGPLTGVNGGPAAVHATFTAAGQPFDVGVPRIPVRGAAEVLPWIILAAGLALAALAVALGVHAARRTRAQDELDRIFTLSPDLIAVADFDGHFVRVNPAVEQVLGYTQEEFLARPYLDLIHPDDRERTAAEADAITEGKTTLSFTNRFIGKDGSPRVLEWTSTPVVEDRLMYAVARDVTARRQAESELRRLAHEQAALRRVATMVARGSSPERIFAKVAEEVGLLLEVDAAVIQCYASEGDATVATVVGSWGKLGDAFPVGGRAKLDGDSATGLVYRTGRPVRFDSYEHVSGSIAAVVRNMGLRSGVGSPIFVNGRLWGSIAAATSAADPLPAGVESRIGEFTELVASAISNVQAQSDLAASRARVVAASDKTRQEIERDLHDGAQQRLIHTVLSLKLARDAVRTKPEAVPALLAEALDHAEQATIELRDLVHGILPPILIHGGLRSAVRSLARRMPVPVEVGVAVDRLPAAVEATAYFVVAEALTNVAKHSRARHATVVARVESSTLQLQVRDDGVGGAQPDGTGFVGLADRLAVFDGHLRVDSPADGGTLVVADIPLPG
jgi:PAS domain S-box-containing protein